MVIVMNTLLEKDDDDKVIFFLSLALPRATHNMRSIWHVS
jgi:hypothetical protein